MGKKVTIYWAPSKISANSSYHCHWLVFGLWQVVNAGTIIQLNSCVFSLDIITFKVAVVFFICFCAIFPLLEHQWKYQKTSVLSLRTTTSELPANLRNLTSSARAHLWDKLISPASFLSTPFQCTLWTLDTLYQILCIKPWVQVMKCWHSIDFTLLNAVQIVIVIPDCHEIK